MTRLNTEQIEPRPGQHGPKQLHFRRSAPLWRHSELKTLRDDERPLRDGGYRLVKNVYVDRQSMPPVSGPKRVGEPACEGRRRRGKVELTMLDDGHRGQSGDAVKPSANQVLSGQNGDGRKHNDALA